MPIEIAAAAGGALAGAAMSWPLELMSGAMTKKRGLEKTTAGKYERWLIPAALAAIGALLFWRVGIGWRLCYLMLTLLCGAAIALLDIKYRVIPNELVLALMALKLAFGLAGAVEFDVWSSLGGLAVCFVLFLLPMVFKKNVGAGDVKLAAAMGFCLGLTQSLLAVIIMGALVFIYTLAQTRTPFLAAMKEFIPMGPFIVLSLMIVQAI